MHMTAEMEAPHSLAQAQVVATEKRRIHSPPPPPPTPHPKHRWSQQRSAAFIGPPPSPTPRLRFDDSYTAPREPAAKNKARQKLGKTDTLHTNRQGHNSQLRKQFRQATTHVPDSKSDVLVLHFLAWKGPTKRGSKIARLKTLPTPKQPC